LNNGSFKQLFITLDWENKFMFIKIKHNSNKIIILFILIFLQIYIIF